MLEDLGEKEEARPERPILAIITVTTKWKPKINSL